MPDFRFYGLMHYGERIPCNRFPCLTPAARHDAGGGSFFIGAERCLPLIYLLAASRGAGGGARSLGHAFTINGTLTPISRQCGAAGGCVAGAVIAGGWASGSAISKLPP